MEQMADEKYKVVFDGSPIDGFTIDAMKINLIAQLKLSDEQQRIIFSGKRVILRQRLDYDAALDYQNALAKLGAKGIIRPMQTIALESATTEPKAGEDAQDEEKSMPASAPSSYSSGQTSANPRWHSADPFIICPKCGAEQIRAEQCMHCGIIFQRYFAIENKLDMGQNVDQLLPKHIGLRVRKKIDNRTGWIRLPGVKTAIVSAFFLVCLFFTVKNSRVWQVQVIQDTLKTQAQQRCADDAVCEFAVRSQIDQCFQHTDLSVYLHARADRKEQIFAEISDQVSQCLVDENGKSLFQ